MPRFLYGERMKKYLFIACGALVAFAYWAGGRVASQKCAVQIAEIRASQQSINMENMVKLNEKVMGTGVRDIRRVLHQKYTIAE